MLLILYTKCSTCINAKKFLENNNIKFETRDIVLDIQKVVIEIMSWENGVEKYNIIPD